VYTPSPSLPALLDELRHRFAPTYREGLTNHLPMACIALDKLGGDDARKRALIDAHAPALEAARPWPAAEIIALEMRERGVDVVVRERLKRDLAGLAGHAFHGVIRLAYATMSKDLEEIAHGLAYLEDNAFPIDIAAHASGATATNELADLADALRLARIEKPSGPNITLRMEQVVGDARFVGKSPAWARAGTSLRTTSLRCMC
jgi:hypothetical protein